MHAPFRKYVSVLLFSALAVTFACSDSDTASPTAPSAPKPAALAAEPMVVTPELVPDAFCSTLPAFRTSLVIVVTAQRDVILRTLRFSFTDRAGRNIFPVIMPTSTSTATQLPSSLPLPLPSSLPIPIPGSMPIPGSVGIQVSGSTTIVDGVVLTTGTPMRLPVILDFGCTVQASGVLAVAADSMTRDGSASTATISVSVRGKG